MTTPFDILGAIGFAQSSFTLLIQTLVAVKALYEEDMENKRIFEEVLRTLRPVANGIESVKVQVAGGKE